MSISGLPEEILLQVFQLLDRLPPSAVKARHEPSLQLTSSEHQDLKHCSKVCKTWRRVVTPLLFKHMRFRLDQITDDQAGRWSRCPFCTETALNQSIQYGHFVDDLPQCMDQYHMDMMLAAGNQLYTRKLSGQIPQDLPFVHGLTELEVFENIRTWVPRFYHGLKEVLEFLEREQLASKIESFTVLTDKMLPEKLDRFPHSLAADRDWRFRAAAAFWRHLLSVINPVTVSILAPPSDLACLTCCAIDTFGDWAFGDMDFHLLSLSQTITDANVSQLVAPVQFEKLSLGGYIPKTFPGVGKASILNLKDWTSAHMNEGSFLKGYATYEYFERGPPSLIYSINTHLSRFVRFPGAGAPSRPRVPGLQQLRHFTYTSIFPYADHFDMTDMLRQIETIDLQLAPGPESTILDDKARLGKAELPDCWNELEHAYEFLTSRLATVNITEETVPNLKTFICRDTQVTGLKAELDDIFTPLCLPVWGEYTEGVYTRLLPRIDEATAAHWSSVHFQ